jgi:hypothetical protein
MKNQFNQKLQTICKKCHSVRKELNFDELPEQMKKNIRELNDRSIKFFNCEKCGEISIKSLRYLNALCTYLFQFQVQLHREDYLSYIQMLLSSHPQNISCQCM